MNVYAMLAVAVLALHLAWIVWVIFGWLATRGRPVLSALHIASLIYGIAIETGPWYCPLTYAEQYFQRKAGMTPYEGSFLVHYLETLIYPDVSPAVLAWCASAVCVFNLAIYGRRWWRGRRAARL